MSRRYHTKHLRNRSNYSPKGADKYGTYREGRQQSPDRIAGKTLPLHLPRSWNDPNEA
jgi:hypothetical protein